MERLKIVFCYYDNINYEARGAEELECLLSLGDVFFVSIQKAVSPLFNQSAQFITKRRNYFRFLSLSKKVIKRIKPDIVFLHDNYCAALIPFIKRRSPSSMITYDMSELYIGDIQRGKHKWLTKILLNDKELKYLKKADLVFCANEERAYISKGYYSLDKLPLVFDNMHKITDEFNEDECNEKYGSLLDGKEFTGLYCGGLIDGGERDIIPIIDAFTQLGNGYRLIIAGSSLEEKNVLDELQKNNSNVGNVTYIGKVNRNVLKYLYTKTNFSIISFKLTDVNTIYCASGKLFESIFCKRPIVLSDNPPHIRMIERYRIGTLSKNHDYAKAIEEMKDNYDALLDNVCKLSDSLDYEKRLKSLKEFIQTNYEIFKKTQK